MASSTFTTDDKYILSTSGGLGVSGIYGTADSTTAGDTTYGSTFSISKDGMVWGDSADFPRKKIIIKCSKCGKRLGSFYGIAPMSDTYCKLCHKLEKLKE